jgi:hypothetical protein
MFSFSWIKQKKHGTYQAGYEIYAVSIVVVIHFHLTGNPFLLASF